MNPTMQTLASHLRQAAAHVAPLEADLNPLIQEGQHALNLARQIPDEELSREIASTAQRIADAFGHLDRLAGLARRAAEKAENYQPPPVVDPAIAQREAVAAAARPPDPTGGFVTPAHWPGGDDTDAILSAAAAEGEDLDLDAVLAETVPTTGEQAAHPAERERLRRAFVPESDAHEERGEAA